MLVHASESGDVPVNVRGTLEAAHDAITAFFVLFALFEAEARVWWVFNHRAFLEALCIGNVLREVAREPGGGESMGKDPLFVRARGDIREFFSLSFSLSFLSFSLFLSFFLFLFLFLSLFLSLFPSLSLSLSASIYLPSFLLKNV